MSDTAPAPLAALERGIVAYDLVAPTANPFTAPRTCPCGHTLPPAGYPTPFRRPSEVARRAESDHAACYRRAREKRLMALNAEHQAAEEEWAVLGVRVDHPAVNAVLVLHHPVISPNDELACDHCEVSDGMEATKQAVWPCDTYAAVRDQVEAACAST